MNIIIITSTNNKHMNKHNHNHDHNHRSWADVTAAEGCAWWNAEVRILAEGVEQFGDRRLFEYMCIYIYIYIICI